MKVLILGDSVPFPHSNGQRIEAAWPQLLLRGLREQGHEVDCYWFRCLAGATVREILIEAQKLRSFMEGPLWRQEFDLAVCQIGAVDSCPRAYPRFMHGLLQNSPIGRSVLRWVSRHYAFLCNLYGRTWTSEKRWRDYVRILAGTLQGYAQRTVFLEICAPGPGLVSKVPGIADKIAGYNRLLRETVAAAATPNRVTVTLAPCAAGPLAELLQADGTHLTERGHQLVAGAVLEHVA